MQKILIVLAATLAGLLLVYWIGAPAPSETDSTPPATEATAASGSNGQTPARDTLSEPTQTLVVVGHYHLTLDQENNLIPTPQVRELFDSIAMKNGSVPVDQWKNGALSTYHAAIPPKPLKQLKALLDQYVEYNLALQLMPMEGAPTLLSALDRVDDMREQYLGRVNAQGLFSDWVQLEQFARDYVTIMTTDNHADHVRQTLQAKIDDLPDTVRPRAQSVLNHSEQLLGTLSVAQADPDGFRSLAEQNAAKALTQPNFTFAEPDPGFMRRYEEYLSARDQALETTRSPEQKQEAVEMLRQELFSGSELLRVETLDRAESL